MKTSAIKIPVSSSIGSVSAEIVEPSGMTSMLVLAHGAGAGMKHDFMIRLSNELADRDVGSLRFNFPFIEKGNKRPDFPAVAEKTIEAAILKTHELFPNTPLFAGGKSFGGRMTSNYLSKNPELIKGIVFFGFPLHPPGKPSTDRATHLKAIELPMLFLQGTRDTLAEWNLIEEVCRHLPTSTLFRVEKADHAFRVAGQDIIPILADQSVSFMKRLSTSPA